MNRIVATALLLTTLLACKDEAVTPNNCGVKRPLDELAWLREIVAKPFALDQTITQYTYQGETIYVLVSCSRCFAGPNVLIYRCDGSVLCSGLVLSTASGNCKAILDMATDRVLLLEREQ